MTFNDVSRIHFDLNQYDRKQDVMQAIEYVKFKGGKTNTAAMFELMFTEVFREDKGDRPGEPTVHGNYNSYILEFRNKSKMDRYPSY